MTKPVPFGKYLLLERLNVGGMAEVFLAKVFGRDGDDRIVAVKRILPALLSDREFVGMFIDEARVVAQLDHRNLVQIFELGRQSDNYYIAMEYLSGCDLRTAIARSRKRQLPLPLDSALFLIGELAAGLDHAHRACGRGGESLGVVHRDVSPQNVVLTRRGGVKLIDFGIAKVATRQNATQVGILKGKFGYMSPEQARGVPIDRRSDLFSLGILLHELLSGQRLFTGESEFAVLDRVRKAEVPRLRLLNPKVPEEVERIVLKMLSRDPGDRHAWASDVAQDLDAFRGRASNESDATALADWMSRVVTEELRQEQDRLRAFAGLSRPPELEPVSLDTFSGRPGSRDPSGALTLGSAEFEMAQTSLLPGLPAELAASFASGPSLTDVVAIPVPETASPPVAPIDRWEATTRPPLPMHLFVAESPPPRDPEALDRGPPALQRRLGLRAALGIGAGLLAAASMAAGGASMKRAYASSGAIAVSARPADGVEVEVDHQPLALGPDGTGVARNLRPGLHFILAQGPLGHRALRVTVVANETAGVDLTFPETSEPPDSVLAHNRQ
jgi:serine/threonine protein kinase